MKAIENFKTNCITFLTLSPPITTKMPYANSLDPDETPSASGSHLDSSCLTLRQYFHQLWATLKHFWKLKQARHIEDDNFFCVLSVNCCLDFDLQRSWAWQAVCMSFRRPCGWWCPTSLACTRWSVWRWWPPLSSGSPPSARPRSDHTTSDAENGNAEKHMKGLSNYFDVTIILTGEEISYC